MTHLYEVTTSFRNWYYRRDPSHVFFYHGDTLAWIAQVYGYSSVSIRGRLAVFQK